MDWSQTTIAGGTLALAIFTLAVAYFTWKLATGQLSIAKQQLQIQLYLELRKEFDGDRLLSARRRLAEKLLTNAPNSELPEVVMNFFEDMGMLFRRGHLDSEMVWDSFGYYARMWWNACKDWVLEERTEDKTFFSDFEYLVEKICDEDVRTLKKTRAELEPSTTEMKEFLEWESRA